jgi:hypothetical protein
LDPAPEALSTFSAPLGNDTKGKAP